MKKISRTGDDFMLGVFFNMKAARSPNEIPIKIEARERIVKFTNVRPISYIEIPNPSSSTPSNPFPTLSLCYLTIYSIALKIKIATASLTTPSPKRMLFNTGNSYSFTIVRAATVSLAQSTLARSRHSGVDRKSESECKSLFAW